MGGQDDNGGNALAHLLSPRLQRFVVLVSGKQRGGCSMTDEQRWGDGCSFDNGGHGEVLQVERLLQMLSNQEI